MATPPSFTTGDVLTAAQMNGVGLWRVTTCTVTSAGGTAATASNGVITIGSGNTSVTVSSAFSSDWDNYRIIINGGVSSATNVLRMTLGSVATGYYTAGKGYTYAGVDVNVGQSNQAFWYGGEGSTNALSMDVTLINPNATKNTQMSAFISPARTDGYGLYVTGYVADTTAHTAFTITASTGTITGGTLRVYGYRN